MDWLPNFNFYFVLLKLLVTGWGKIMKRQKKHLRRLQKAKKWYHRNLLSIYIKILIWTSYLCYFLLFNLLPLMSFHRPWDAAKHMESAGALAKDLNRWSEVSDHYRRASELYMECGRSQPASDALAKGARYVNFFVFFFFLINLWGWEFVRGFIFIFF